MQQSLLDIVCSGVEMVSTYLQVKYRVYDQFEEHGIINKCVIHPQTGYVNGIVDVKN
jgi:hypothetical protein